MPGFWPRDPESRAVDQSEGIASGGLAGNFTLNEIRDAWNNKGSQTVIEKQIINRANGEFMKKLLTGLLLMTSFSAFAEDPFDQFLGEYAVKSEKCSDVSPYFEKLEALKITKGIFSNRNLESTFIHFKRGGYYSESLNLSAYRRLIDYTENQGAVFSAQKLKTFSIDRLDENTFSFHFFEDWGASGVDECSYVLELIR